MIHSSVDPRQSIPLSFLPNSLHAAASGVSHSSASRAGLGAAPLFLDNHFSVSSGLRALKVAARRLVMNLPDARQQKTSPGAVPAADADIKASQELCAEDTSIPTPPTSPQLSFASIPINALSELASRDVQRLDAAATCVHACDNKQVDPASAMSPSEAATQRPAHAKLSPLATDCSYLLTPAASPKSELLSPPTERSVSFAAELVTQTIPTYSHDEYPDRSDATPPRRLKFAEAAQVMAFQSLMRRQHAMIAVDDEAADFVQEKCPACKGLHAPLSAKMQGWTVPTLEYMEEMGM